MIPNYVGAIIATLTALALLKISRVAEYGGKAITRANHTIRLLTNPEIGDDEKERAARSSARVLFADFAAITLRLAAAVAAPILILAVLDAYGLCSLDGILSASLSAPFIIGTAAFAALVIWLSKERPQ